MTEVYYTDFSEWNARLPAEKLAARLSARRQERIRSCRMEKNRMQSLAAGLLLDFGLKKYGLTEREAQIQVSARGKPFLSAAPGLKFSLSHSGSCAMLVLSGQECGCDIQKISLADPRVCARVLTKEEATYLERFLQGPERDMKFTELWTRKESFVKMTGEGLGRLLSGFGVLPGYKPAGCALFTWELAGYAASVCLKERGKAGSGTRPSLPTPERIPWQVLIESNRSAGPESMLLFSTQPI